MTAGTKSEYWDTCIFLALIKGEVHRPGELEYIQKQALLFDNGALTIVTSSITVAEIRNATLDEDQIRRLDHVYRRSNFHFIDVTLQVAQTASKIRSFYTANPMLSSNNKPLMLHTPDAIHVASVIAAQRGAKQAVKLLTLDSDNKPKHGSIGLGKLNGLVAGEFNLVIGRPEIKGGSQSLLELPLPPAPPPLPALVPEKAECPDTAESGSKKK